MMMAGRIQGVSPIVPFPDSPIVENKLLVWPSGQGEYLGNHFTPDEAESCHIHQNDDKNSTMMMMIRWD